MAIAALSIPTRTAGTSTGNPADINAITAKINELASAMSISPLSLNAQVGAGNPAGDVNTIVSKVNQLVTASNGTGTPTKLSTPTGTASGLSTSAISVGAGADANATSWALSSATAANGPFAVLASGLSSPSYTHTGLAASTTIYYQWQKIGDGTTFTSSNPSAVFSASTQAAGSAGNTLTFAPEDFAGSGINPLENGRVRPDEFGYVTFRTTGTQATFTVYTTHTYRAKVMVLIGETEVHLDLPNPDANNAYPAALRSKDFALAVPANTPIRVTVGDQSRDGDTESTTDYIGFTTVSITGSANDTLTKLAPVNPTGDALCVLGNSILGVSEVGLSGTDSAFCYLRDHLPNCYLTHIGYGSLRVGHHLDTAARRQAEVDKMKPRLAGVAAPKIMLADFINDYNTSLPNSSKYTPAQLRPMLDAFIGLALAQIPGLVAKNIILSGPPATNLAGANSLGFTLADYTTMTRACASDNGCTLFDMSLYGSSDNTIDGVHPNHLYASRLALALAQLLQPYVPALQDMRQKNVKVVGVGPKVTPSYTVAWYQNLGSSGQFCTYALNETTSNNRLALSPAWPDSNFYLDSGDISSSGVTAGRLKGPFYNDQFARLHHVAVRVTAPNSSYPTGLMELLYDGQVFSSQQTYSPFTPGDFPLYVGGVTPGTPSFIPLPGSLADFKVWGYGRSSAKLRADMLAKGTGAATNLLLNLDLTAQDAQSDSSGNGYTVTSYAP